MPCVTCYTCPYSKNRKLKLKEVGEFQGYSAMTIPGFKPSVAECWSPAAGQAGGGALGVLPELQWLNSCPALVWGRVHRFGS